VVLFVKLRADHGTMPRVVKAGIVPRANNARRLIQALQPSGAAPADIGAAAAGAVFFNNINMMVIVLVKGDMPLGDRNVAVARLKDPVARLTSAGCDSGLHKI
jgi:hypothetical protein